MEQPSTIEDGGANEERSAASERDLVASGLLAGPRDANTLDRIVRLYAPLVNHLASRFAHRGEPLEDIVQVANLALLKAAERFDPEVSPRFSSYAIPTIVGEIKRHFRDSCWSMRVPRQVQERSLRVRDLTVAMTQELGRSPTVAELAERSGSSVDEVLEALDAAAAYRLETLDSDEPGDAPARQPPPEEDGRFELVEGWAQLAPLLRRLGERERTLLYMRFVEEHPQRQIAEALGISQMHVSRLLRQTLERLRTWASEPAEEVTAR